MWARAAGRQKRLSAPRGLRKPEKREEESGLNSQVVFAPAENSRLPSVP